MLSSGKSWPGEGPSHPVGRVAVTRDLSGASDGPGSIREGAAEMATTEPEWHTPQQVADRLGVNVATVRRWIGAGLLEAIVTPTGRYLISADTLAYWLA